MRVYALSTFTIAAQVSAHARWINALQLHPSKRLFATAAEDGVVCVWNFGEDGRYSTQPRYSKRNAPCVRAHSQVLRQVPGLRGGRTSAQPAATAPEERETSHIVGRMHACMRIVRNRHATPPPQVRGLS